MASCWIYVSGDSFPFRGVEAADVFLDRVDPAPPVEAPDWVSVTCAYPTDETQSDFDVRTTFIRASAIVAVSPAPPLHSL